MSTDSNHDVTRLLQDWNAGDAQASGRLLPLIYNDLRRIARSHMRQERAGHTLQATALVHEAYLKLTRGEPVPWQDRAHFFSLAARAMRRILVNHARDRQRLKRGGVDLNVVLAQTGDLAQPGPESEVDLVALDGVLARFTEAYPRQGQVIELRFFGEMETRDIAEVLQISEKTVLRDWQFARLWLRRELGKMEE